MCPEDVLCTIRNDLLLPLPLNFQMHPCPQYRYLNPTVALWNYSLYLFWNISLISLRILLFQRTDPHSYFLCILLSSLNGVYHLMRLINLNYSVSDFSVGYTVTVVPLQNIC